MKTKTFEEAFKIFNELMEEKGLWQITVNEAKTDYGIKGGETVQELAEMVNDIWHDEQTNKAAIKDQWRYDR